MEIDKHLGCAMSGLTADARTMIDHARVTAQNHNFTYDENIKVESVTQAVCDLALRFGESVHDEDAMMSRPFGVALLIAGADEKGPQLLVSISIFWSHKILTSASGSTQIHLARSCDTRRKLLDQVQKLRRRNCRISGTRYVVIHMLGVANQHFMSQQLSLLEAQLLALRVLKQVMEEKLDHHNVQLAQVIHFSVEFIVSMLTHSRSLRKKGMNP